jgi:tetratricopeptide (TPR) repeat protein
MTGHGIPWRDNGIVIAAIGGLLFLLIIAMEYVYQEIKYREPVVHVDLLAANETDSEENSTEIAQLSADEIKTARQIITALMQKEDTAFDWARLQQQYPQMGEEIWLDVAVSADKRAYHYSANTIVESLLANNTQNKTKSLPVLFQYAKLASDQDDNPLAIERYQHLLENFPNHQAGLFNLSLLLAREDRHPEALKTVSRAIATTSGELKAKALSVRASSHLALQQYPQAVVDFRASIQYRPSHASTWRKLAGALLYSSEDEKEILQAYDQAISLHADYMQALHERGQFHWLRGEFTLARQDLEKVRAVAPDYQPNRWTLLHLYLALEKRRSAREEIRWLRSQEHAASETDFLEGLERWSKQDYQKSTAVFAKLGTETHDNVWLNYYLAVSSVRAGENIQAEVIARLQSLQKNPWMYSVASLALAEALLQSQQDQQAITVLQNLGGRYPASHYYAYTLGRTLLDEDYYLEAASALQRAMNIDPSDNQTRLSLGLAYTRGNQLELALLTYEALLESSPGHRAGRYNYALLLEDLNRPLEAIEHLQQLMQIDAENINAQYRLASLLADQSQFEQAIVLLNQALAERPTHHRARTLLAEVQHQRGAQKLALDEVNRLLVLQGQAPSIIALKSDILRDLDRLPESAELLLALADKDSPRNVLIKLYNIGVRALNTGQLGLAETCNRRVIALDPTFDKAWVNLSSALNRQRYYQQTVDLLSARQDLLTSNNKLVINLAEAHHNLGNSQIAVALLEPLQQQNLLSEEGALVLAASYRGL